MLEELWNGVIQLTEPYVVPDWGALVGLIPILLAGLAAIYLLWLGARFATAGPTRRGIRRVEPVAPPGLHMPGPSFAPVLAAVGLFLLVFGLIAGGITVILGTIALVVTLLYWGREALADYDHLPDVAEAHGGEAALTAPAERTPPPGVHMPPPSFRPLLVSVAMTILVLGLVLGGWVLIAGLLAIVLTGLGWLRDARAEYRAVEAADRTGHLDSGGTPRWPTTTFAVLLGIVVVAVVLNSGVLPIGSGSAGGGGGAAPSSAPGGGAGGGAGPTPAASEMPAADVVIAAQNIAYLQQEVTVPAGRDFTIAFDNRDPATPHNIEIKDASGTTLFKGDIFSGPEVRVYKVPALAAGSYPFVCTVHPNMTGTITAQ
jgi:plastocyanin